MLSTIAIYCTVTITNLLYLCYKYYELKEFEHL